MTPIPRRIFMKGFGIGAMLLGCAASVQAGTVSIETQVQTAIEQGVLRVSIVLVNRGDEPAYHVQVTAESQDLAWTSPVKDVLPPYEQHAMTFEHTVSALRQGRYPLILRVHYTDANRYPFSALTMTEFTVGQAAAQDMLGILDGVAMQEEGRLTLRLKNLTPEPQTVTVRLVLPDELSAEPSNVTPTLAANQEIQVAFRVKNFSALNGSTYPVYAFIEHDHRGFHQTIIAAGTVQIGFVHRLQRYRPWLVGSVVGLLGGLVILNGWALWKSHTSRRSFL